MIPFRTGNRIAFQKDQSQITLSSRTDIDRLWRLQTQQTDGAVNTETAPTGSQPFIPTWFEGLATAAFSAPTNGQTAPTTLTALAWIVDPASTGIPVNMINASTPVTIVNRDTSLSGNVGTYCCWELKQLSNGLAELRLVWAGCQ